MMVEEARAEWRRAKTFPELCELMARFIEGSLPYSPGGLESLDEESAPLVATLAALNRRGFLTVGSQPGGNGNGWSQRAYVEGFAPSDVAFRNARKALYSSLYIDFVPRQAFRDDGRYLLPLSVADGHATAWLGDGPPRIGAASMGFLDDLGPLGFSAIDDAWWVAIVDLEWGREEYLWRLLLEEPRDGYSVNPHPDLDVGRWYDQ